MKLDKIGSLLKTNAEKGFCQKKLLLSFKNRVSVLWFHFPIFFRQRYLEVSSIMKRGAAFVTDVEIQEVQKKLLGYYKKNRNLKQ